MAQAITDQESKQIISKNNQDIQNKVAIQAVQGKPFVLDEHSSGVIPEAVWTNLPGKSIEDSEAVE